MIVSAMLLGAIHATTSAALRERSLFDAIIVGAGAAGGFAAMLLTQAGLRVLVLDAGWERPAHRSLFRRSASAFVRTIAHPGLHGLAPPAVRQVGRKVLSAVGKVRQPVQSKCFAWPLNPDAFVDDRDVPYMVQDEKPFAWFRSRQIGGRMTVPGHGRQYYRLSPSDFQSNNPRVQSWPFATEEIDPWYDFVEEKLQLEGGDDTSAHQPDSRLAKTTSPLPAEQELCEKLKERWPGVTPLMGRHAPHLDAMNAAAATGRLSCRRGAVVKNVEVEADGKLKGVKWRDAETGADMEAEAPVVFMCASALESTRILMNSRSSRFPDGIGRDSGALGSFLMDHLVASGEGIGEGLPGEPVPNAVGRCVYVPRFDLRGGAEASDVPFGVQLYRYSTGSGRSAFTAVSFGEMAPRAENKVELHPTRVDAFGMPLLRITCTHDETERAAGIEQAAAIREVADLTGVKLYKFTDKAATPGTAMHECGTARMGTSASNSVFDPNNESWDVKGLYLTDGACFPSQGAQNPTLTIMALTARACAHAIAKSSVSMGTVGADILAVSATREVA